MKQIKLNESVQFCGGTLKVKGCISNRCKYLTKILNWNWNAYLQWSYISLAKEGGTPWNSGNSHVDVKVIVTIRGKMHNLITPNPKVKAIQVRLNTKNKNLMLKPISLNKIWSLVFGVPHNPLLSSSDWSSIINQY